MHEEKCLAVLVGFFMEGEVFDIAHQLLRNQTGTFYLITFPQ